jgi:hypothetical protein
MRPGLSCLAGSTESLSLDNQPLSEQLDDQLSAALQAFDRSATRSESEMSRAAALLVPLDLLGQSLAVPVDDPDVVRPLPNLAQTR